MNLKDGFNNFCKENKLSSLRYKANKKIFEHGAVLDFGFKVAKTLTKFTTEGNPLALVEGAFEIVSDLGSRYHPDSFFSRDNGWESIQNKQSTISIKFLEKTLTQYPFTFIKFGGIHSSSYYGKIYYTPWGEVGVSNYKDNENDSDLKLHYKFAEINKTQLIGLIIDKAAEEFTTNFISLDIGKDKTSLISEEFFDIPSERSQKYTAYIKKCLGLGINRSILMYGPPGTGKTTLAQSIIKELGFRTLKFRYSDGFNLNTFKFFIEQLKIEAIVIDDLDHSEAPEDLLEFLEICKKKMKLIIGTVNSLKEFHPAILRPGRFDEIVEINTLEQEVIEEILGPLKDFYNKKVKNWPIAYINELVFRSKLMPADELEKSFTELDDRVTRQLDNLSDKNSKEKTSSSEDKKKSLDALNETAEEIESILNKLK